MKPLYCKAPFVHINQRNDAYYYPCCRFRANEEDMPQIGDYTNLVDAFNSPQFVNIRDKMLAGEIVNGCNKCHAEVAVGKTPMSNIFNKFDDTSGDIQFLEVMFSNECNLKCRMCDVYSSNKLYDDAVALNDEFNMVYNIPDSATIKYDMLESVKKLTTYTWLKIMGGEPFLTPSLLELMDHLIENGRCHDISLEFSTNGTLFPTKYIEKLKKFKNVGIYISVDGLYNLTNYIRHGKSWDIVSTNIDLWKNSGFDMGILTTVQAYNLHQLNKIRDYASGRNITHQYHLLKHPNHLSLKALPNDYVAEIGDLSNFKMPAIIPDDALFDKFKRYTFTLDRMRNESIEMVIPELYKYMK